MWPVLIAKDASKWPVLYKILAQVTRILIVLTMLSDQVPELFSVRQTSFTIGWKMFLSGRKSEKIFETGFPSSITKRKVVGSFYQCRSDDDVVIDILLEINSAIQVVRT